MGRIPRHRLGSGVFHVMNRGINRAWIISDDVDKQFFVNLLIRFKAGYAVNVYHWAVMASHFHIAIETLRMADLSEFVGKVTRRYTTYHHRRYGGSGPLWVRRFKSVLVEKERYLLRLGRYIERNGVRAGAAPMPWDYRFCSAGAYASGRDDGLVNPAEHPVWMDLSETQPKRRQAYRRFLMEAEAAQEDEAVFRSARRVIGEDPFCANARHVAGRQTSRGRGRKRKS